MTTTPKEWVERGQASPIAPCDLLRVRMTSLDLSRRGNLTPASKMGVMWPWISAPCLEQYSWKAKEAKIAYLKKNLFLSKPSVMTPLPRPLISRQQADRQPLKKNKKQKQLYIYMKQHVQAAGSKVVIRYG